jgi:hypothetical protein
MRKEMQSKDNTELLTHKSLLYIHRLYFQLFLNIYGRSQDKEKSALRAQSIIDSLSLKGFP